MPVEAPHVCKRAKNAPGLNITQPFGNGPIYDPSVARGQFGPALGNGFQGDFNDEVFRCPFYGYAVHIPQLYLDRSQTVN